MVDDSGVTRAVARQSVKPTDVNTAAQNTLISTLVNSADLALQILNRQPPLQVPVALSYIETMSYLEWTPKDELMRCLISLFADMDTHQQHDPDKLFVHCPELPAGHLKRVSLTEVFAEYRSKQQLLGYSILRDVTANVEVYAYEDLLLSSGRYRVARLSYAELRDICSMASRRHFFGVGVKQTPKSWLADALAAQRQTEAHLRLSDRTLSVFSHKLITTLTAPLTLGGPSSGEEQPGVFALEVANADSSYLALKGAFVLTESPRHLPEKTTRPVVLLIQGRGIEEFANGAHFQQQMQEVWCTEPEKISLFLPCLGIEDLANIKQLYFRGVRSRPFTANHVFAELLDQFIRKQYLDLQYCVRHLPDEPLARLDASIDLRGLFRVSELLNAREAKRLERTARFEQTDIFSTFFNKLIKHTPDLKRLQDKLPVEQRFNLDAYYVNGYVANADNLDGVDVRRPVFTQSLGQVLMQKIKGDRSPNQNYLGTEFFYALSSTALYGEPDMVWANLVDMIGSRDESAVQYAMTQSAAAKAHAAEVADIDKMLAALGYNLIHGVRATPFLSLALDIVSTVHPSVEPVVHEHYVETHPHSLFFWKTAPFHLMSLAVLLKRYGLGIPQNVEQRTKVVNALCDLRASLNLRMMTGTPLVDAVLNDLSINAVVERAQQFIAAQEASHTTASPAHLLDTLWQALPESDQVWVTKYASVTPTAALEVLLLSATAQQLGRELIQSLSWYGSEPGEQITPVFLAQLVCKAVALVDGQASPGDVWDNTTPCGTLIMWGKSYARLQAERQEALLGAGKASSKAFACLLERVMRGSLSADFFIRDIPNDLSYGSVRWLTFKHGVNLVQAINSDAAWRMSFQDITALVAQMASQTLDAAAPAQAQAAQEKAAAFAAARMEPAIVWAVVHGIVPCKPFVDYKPHDIEYVAAQLDRHEQLLLASAKALSVVAPDRMARARAELAHFKLSPERRLVGPGAVVATLLDVYASEKDLNQWQPYYDRRVEPTAQNLEQHAAFIKAYRRLVALNFEQGFAAFLSAAKAGYQVVIATLLAGLPRVDRIALENGQVQMYTLRQVIGYEEPGKVDRIKSDSVGRFGFILKSSYLNITRFYEVFAREMIINPLPHDFTLVVGGVMQDLQIGGSGLHTYTYLARNGTSMAFDWSAYQKGTRPEAGKTSTFIADLLGEVLLANPYEHAQPPTPKTLTSLRTQAITQTIAQHLFYVNERALYSKCKGATSLEGENPLVVLLKWFLPFWGTLEDLFSGDPDRIEQATLSAVTDLLIFLPIGKFLGGTARVLRLTAGLGFRVVIPRLAPLAGHLVISLSKEILPDPVALLQGVGRLLKWGGKGALARGRRSYTLISNGLQRFRQSAKELTGQAGHYNLVRDLAVVDPGRWKPLATGDELFMFEGIDHVPVRNIATRIDPTHVLVDSLSGVPFGPRLYTTDDAVERTMLAIKVELSKASKVQESGKFSGLYALDNKQYVEFDVYIFEVQVAGPSNRLRIVDSRAITQGSGPYFLMNNNGFIEAQPQAFLNVLRSAEYERNLQMAVELQIESSQLVPLLEWTKRLYSGRSDIQAHHFLRGFDFPKDSRISKYQLLLEAIEQESAIPRWAQQFLIPGYWRHEDHTYIPALNALWRLDKTRSKEAIEQLWGSFNMTGEPRTRFFNELCLTGTIPDWAQQWKLASNKADDLHRFDALHASASERITEMQRHSGSIRNESRSLVREFDSNFLDAYYLSRGYLRNEHDVLYRTDIGAVFRGDHRLPSTLCADGRMMAFSGGHTYQTTTGTVMASSFQLRDAQQYAFEEYFASAGQLRYRDQFATSPRPSSSRSGSAGESSADSSPVPSSPQVQQIEGVVYVIDVRGVEVVPIADNVVINPRQATAQGYVVSAEAHISVSPNDGLQSERLWLHEKDGTRIASIHDLNDHAAEELALLENDIRSGSDTQRSYGRLFYLAAQDPNIKLLDLENVGEMRNFTFASP